MSQHPPVVASGLRSVQTAAQLLPDGQRDAEGVWPHQGGDVAGRVHQGRVYALDLLVGQTKVSFKGNSKEAFTQINCSKDVKC